MNLLITIARRGFCSRPPGQLDKQFTNFWNKPQWKI